ncbi:unnamed protein product [Hyaloperonospora brassicae]|uniref:Nep1-like protein n=1 Tax=Hyaloperonospora brassicae TaxID=162125 RepID=A0AAV0TY46_HYABA|nr:unnamed protein product [Hyaloperonospora brassicae]
MKTDVFVCAALFAAAVAQGQKMPEGTAQQDDVSSSTPKPTRWAEVTIGCDQVKPFAQRKAETVSDKASVKFKPQFSTDNGCQPYPAVNEAGETSGGLVLRPTIDGGLELAGSGGEGCQGSPYGSQIYARSTWYEGIWAILYTWYLLKDETELSHQVRVWVHLVVWVNNPAVTNSTIRAVTMQGGTTKVPSGDELKDGVGVKVKHVWDEKNLGRMPQFTTEDGKEQDLITWDQLSENARSALNEVLWGELPPWAPSSKMPLSDDEFESHLKQSWPFRKKN